MKRALPAVVILLVLLALSLAQARSTRVHDTVIAVNGLDALEGKSLGTLHLEGVTITASGKKLDDALKYISSYVLGRQVLVEYDPAKAKTSGGALECAVYFVYGDKPYSLADTLVSAGYARWADEEQSAVSRDESLTLKATFRYPGEKSAVEKPTAAYLVGINSPYRYEASLAGDDTFTFTGVKPHDNYYLITFARFGRSETYQTEVLVPDAYQNAASTATGWRPPLGEGDRVVEIYRGYDGRLRYRVERTRTVTVELSWHLVMALKGSGAWEVAISELNMDRELCREIKPFEGKGMGAYSTSTKAIPTRASP